MVEVNFMDLIMLNNEMSTTTTTTGPPPTLSSITFDVDATGAASLTTITMSTQVTAERAVDSVRVKVPTYDARLEMVKTTVVHNDGRAPDVYVGKVMKREEAAAAVDAAASAGHSAAEVFTERHNSDIVTFRIANIKVGDVITVVASCFTMVDTSLVNRLRFLVPLRLMDLWRGNIPINVRAAVPLNKRIVDILEVGGGVFSGTGVGALHVTSRTDTAVSATLTKSFTDRHMPVERSVVVLDVLMNDVEAEADAGAGAGSEMDSVNTTFWSQSKSAGNYNVNKDADKDTDEVAGAGGAGAGAGSDAGAGTGAEEKLSFCATVDIRAGDFGVDVEEAPDIVAIAVDVSGSMREPMGGDGGGVAFVPTRTRLDCAKSATELALGSLSTQSLMQLISFESRCKCTFFKDAGSGTGLVAVPTTTTSRATPATPQNHFSLLGHVPAAGYATVHDSMSGQWRVREPKFAPVNNDTLLQARTALGMWMADGGTALLPVLNSMETCFKELQEKHAAAKSAVLIVITDGDVPDTDTCIAKARVLYEQHGLRICVITVGPDASQSLAQRITAVSGGTSMAFVRGTQDEFVTAVMTFLSQGVVDTVVKQVSASWRLVAADGSVFEHDSAFWSYSDPNTTYATCPKALVRNSGVTFTLNNVPSKFNKVESVTIRGLVNDGVRFEKVVRGSTVLSSNRAVARVGPHRMLVTLEAAMDASKSVSMSTSVKTTVESRAAASAVVASSSAAIAALALKEQMSSKATSFACVPLEFLNKNMWAKKAVEEVYEAGYAREGCAIKKAAPAAATASSSSRSRGFVGYAVATSSGGGGGGGGFGATSSGGGFGATGLAGYAVASAAASSTSSGVRARGGGASGGGFVAEDHFGLFEQVKRVSCSLDDSDDSDEGGVQARGGGGGGGLVSKGLSTAGGSKFGFGAAIKSALQPATSKIASMFDGLKRSRDGGGVVAAPVAFAAAAASVSGKADAAAAGIPVDIAPPVPVPACGGGSGDDDDDDGDEDLIGGVVVRRAKAAKTATMHKTPATVDTAAMTDCEIVMALVKIMNADGYWSMPVIVSTIGGRVPALTALLDPSMTDLEATCAILKFLETNLASSKILWKRAANKTVAWLKTVHGISMPAF